MKLIPEEVIKLKVKELRELAKDFPIGKLGSEFITSTFKNGDKTSLTDYEKFLIALQAFSVISNSYFFSKDELFKAISINSSNVKI